MTPTKYRKKPVVIQAMQWRGGPSEASDVIDWVLAEGETSARWHEPQPETTVRGKVVREAVPEFIAIDTLEGVMRATPGDYIIRGVQGEFYPCKPDIFAKTYDVTEVGPVSTHDIGGAEVDLQIPEDAVVTGAIIIACYQRMDEGEPAAGAVWGISPLPHTQAVGMMRVATIAIENIGDYR